MIFLLILISCLIILVSLNLVLFLARLKPIINLLLIVILIFFLFLNQLLRGLGCNPRLAARSGGLVVCLLAAAQVAGCPFYHSIGIAHRGCAKV